MIALPVASITCAPCVSHVPTQLILPFLTTTVPLGITWRFSIVMMRAFVSATLPDGTRFDTFSVMVMVPTLFVRVSKVRNQVRVVALLIQQPPTIRRHGRFIDVPKCQVHLPIAAIAIHRHEIGSRRIRGRTGAR
jgi:hypothetical protein